MYKISTIFYLFSFFYVASSVAQDAWNVEQFGLVNRGDDRYSGSWSYIAPDGSEYALVGAKTGTAVYPIDDPSNIVEVGYVPGPATNWREITVIGDHAFVATDVQDVGHSMQVIDLSYLPDSVSLVKSYTETFTEGHIIQKDIFNEEPYVYVMGTCNSCGVHILDVSDPENPVEVGRYDPGYYIHDAHIRGDILFASAFYEGTTDIVDISDKTNPILIGQVTNVGNNTHSSSMSLDGKVLYICDENDGNPMHVVNIEDISDPRKVFQYTANAASLVHNPYVRGDFLFLTHNTEGLRVLDIADPELPVEVGYFDTYDGPSGGFSGLWSACPYFPSGKIIGGDRTKGLFIWTFNDTRAARIYGVVKDSLTGEALFSAEIEIPELSENLPLDLSGNFKRGLLSGTYSLNTSLANYQPKTIELDLAQGDSVWVEIPLVPEVLSSGFENQLHLPELAVFPNPTSSAFSVDLEGFQNASTLQMYDEKGRLLASEIIDNQLIARIEGKFPKGRMLLLLRDKSGKIIGKCEVLIQ